jgi:hypothetical protein
MCGEYGNKGDAERRRPKRLHVLHVSRSVPLIGPSEVNESMPQ